MSLSYAYEKLMIAVDVLATSPQTIQNRLGNAFISGLTRINPEEDLPVNLRTDFQQLLDQVTRVAAVGDEGTISATTRIMSDDEAAEIAKKILNLFHQVFEALPQKQSFDK